MFGGDGISFTKYGDGNAAILGFQGGAGVAGLGWDIQAARATAISSTSIYDQITLLAEKLNQNEVPEDNRFVVIPPEIKTMLVQAAETQPTGISEMYTGTVTNGKVMRIGGFDIHVAAGSRLSLRSGHGIGSGDFTSGTGYLMIAGRKGFIQYADKWSESRVVDAENQFAKKYQGLYLYGALVPAYARKYGAVLFGNY